MDKETKPIEGKGSPDTLSELSTQAPFDDASSSLSQPSSSVSLTSETDKKLARVVGQLQQLKLARASSHGGPGSESSLGSPASSAKLKDAVCKMKAQLGKSLATGSNEGAERPLPKKAAGVLSGHTVLPDFAIWLHGAVSFQF